MTDLNERVRRSRVARRRSIWRITWARRRRRGARRSTGETLRRLAVWRAARDRYQAATWACLTSAQREQVRVNLAPFRIDPIEGVPANVTQQSAAIIARAA